jgi:hypothetical protein
VIEADDDEEGDTVGRVEIVDVIVGNEAKADLDGNGDPLVDID